MNELKQELSKRGMIHPDIYYNKRLSFIKWARNERYTLKAIGEVLGITKEAVYKIIKLDIGAKR